MTLILDPLDQARQTDPVQHASGIALGKKKHTENTAF
jgi:hypothetical protein